MTDGSSSSSPRVRGASGPGRVVEAQPGDVEEDPAGQRVAVAAQARRRQADEHVARGDTPTGRTRSRSTTPTAKPARSKWSGSRAPGVLGRLAPQQGAPGPPAALGHPADDARPPPPGRACPRRRSRGGRGARPRCRPGRPRTWPRGRSRWCRGGRPRRPRGPWCPPRPWRRRAPGPGARRRGRTARRSRRCRPPPRAGWRRRRTSGCAGRARSPASMSTPAAA